MKYIYGLIDPTDRKIKYVGQTIDLGQRYSNHLSRNESTAKGEWIRGLREANKSPDYVILGTCDDKDVYYLENWWIVLGGRQGWDLTNGTYPGEWRVRDDFQQIFSERLAIIEMEHKQNLKKLEKDHEETCKRLENEAISREKKKEREMWIGFAYMIAYTIIILSFIMSAYESFFLASVHNKEFWIPVVCIRSLLLMYPVIHYVERKYKLVETGFTVAFILVFILSACDAISSIYELGRMAR